MNNLKKVPESIEQAFEMMKEAWRVKDFETFQTLISFVDRAEFKEECDKFIQKLFPGMKPIGFSKNGSNIYSIDDMAKKAKVKPEIILGIIEKIPNADVFPLTLPEGSTIH